MSPRISRPFPLFPLLRRWSQRALAAVLGSVLCAAPSTLAFADDLRLPTDVMPTFQTIQLTLDADKPDYSGRVKVELEVLHPTAAIHFHAQEMTLTRVDLRGTGVQIPLTPETGTQGMVTARAPAPIAPGKYTLTIDFQNDFDRRASSLYRLETGGRWYAFTQFEAIDARKAFPCWDEPSFKFPYQITLSVPEAHQAVSNTPVESETVEGGVKTVVFAKTKPLPSYLLAIATGPLEFVPIPGLRVPGRVVTPKGSTKLTQVAVAMTPPLFNALERYFGIPYPYEKLDLIAVPEFSPGAMENPGAITYADRFLLFDEKTMSVSQRRTFAVYTAHEISHMWFGDYVTMKWWDDLWLNESFAEWMGNKIADEVNPRFLVRLEALRELQLAFGLDAQLSTRAIRQPVKSVETLAGIADYLAYNKGQAVLGMTERWLGPSVFRKGVISYLKAHAFATAEGMDLWNALGQASGKDVPGVLSSFLDQPGVPIVHAELHQDGKVALSQKRFLNFGTVSPGPELWKIPVTLMWESRGKPASLNVLLDRERLSVKLPKGARPAWIHPNADEAGYYRWSVDSTSLTHLTAAAPTALTAQERIGFVQNATALLRAGTIRGDQYLQILVGFSGDSNPLVISALSSALTEVKEGFLTDQNEEAFAAYVRRVLGPALRRFGLERSPNEDEGISLVRPSLYAWLGDEGRDEKVLARAEALARSFLKDRGSVDPSLVGLALRLSAIRGDSALFEEYRKRFEGTTIPTDREIYLKALGNFREPKLRARALTYARSGPLRPQELFWIPETIAEVPKQRDEAWAWWQASYDDVVPRMPPDYPMFVPYMVSGCSETRLKQAEAFFTEPKHSPPGTANELAKVTEAMRDCIGLRAREGEAVNRAMAQIAQAK